MDSRIVHCDNQLKEEWYRFEGEAGTQLADERSRPGWEVCGTSRVGWLEGKHPSLDEGTVNRTLCVTEISGHCGYSQKGQVRACRDSDGEFYVYRLPQQEAHNVLDDDADCNDNDNHGNGDKDLVTITAGGWLPLGLLCNHRGRNSDQPTT